MLWGGNTDGGQCNIWSADLATGIATFRFSFSAPNCGVTFFDGITVDRVTDTLYVSPDVHTEIFHMNKDGTPGVNGTIDFESLTAGQCPWAQGFGASGCFNSGLAIGLDGNLFAGTAQDGKIFVVDSGTGTVFGPFASGTTIKYTQAPGATPSINAMGSSNGAAGAIAWHITGQGDMEVYAVDNAGNQSGTISCLVPPPPK